jgi:hypothetical protein
MFTTRAVSAPKKRTSSATKAAAEAAATATHVVTPSSSASSSSAASASASTAPAMIEVAEIKVLTERVFEDTMARWCDWSQDALTVGLPLPVHTRQR